MWRVGAGVRKQRAKVNERYKKKVDNGGEGSSLDVTLETEHTFGAVPDQGWNTTTS